MKDNEVIYRNQWVINRIYEVSDRIREKVVDQTKFEERCIKRVLRYLLGNKKREKHRRYIERMIQAEASDYIKRSAEVAETTLFSEVLNKQEDSEDIEYEPEDVLTNVESEIITKETIALLTQDDRSKKVLEAWSIGNTNNTEISRMLTHTIGGKTETHRKFIQRFEKNCREQLSAAI